MSIISRIAASFRKLLTRVFITKGNHADDLMTRRLARFNAIFERVSPEETARTGVHYRTRPGRHPLESRSKYTGNGALRK